MSDIAVQTLKNGPYLVSGPVQLIDADGTLFTVDKESVALCRYGASTTKPFCDGTHSKIGFEAAERAA